MHKVSELLRILTALNLHFPQTGRAPQELQLLASDWIEDLAAYSLPVIEKAAKKARRELRFFPCTAEMLELCDMVQKEAERVHESLALPEPEPNNDDYCERGKAWCEKIKAKLHTRAFPVANSMNRPRAFYNPPDRKSMEQAYSAQLEKERKERGIA